MVLEYVKQIMRVTREICYFKKIIKQYGAKLKRGRYYLFPSLRAIAADNPFSIENAQRYFAKKVEPSKTQSLIRKINETNYYYNKKSGTGELYEAVYSANNYDKVREIKLFSFERKEILTICTCPQACHKQLEEFAQLHPYFGMPRLTKQAGTDHGYKISMVDLWPRPDELQALAIITQCGMRYHTAHSQQTTLASVQQYMDIPYEENALAQPLADLAEKIAPQVRELEIPLCLQHGDLSRDNLIYGTCDEKTDFWWIDWEHAGVRPFFFDYFFYILNTAVYFQDATALQYYLDGQCDEQLAAFFEIFGVQYQPAHRKDYFLIFALAFLKERVGDRGDTRAMQMYYDFICEMILK